MNKIIEGVYVCERCKKDIYWKCPNPFYIDKFVSVNWNKDVFNVKNWSKDILRDTAILEIICPYCGARNFIEKSK